MELNVPYVKQPVGSVLCGAASATMVLRFLGKQISLKRVVRELCIKSSRGVNCAHLASYFLQHNMDVVVQAWPHGMSEGLRSVKLLKGESAITALKRGVQDGTRSKARVLCRELTALAKKGGGVILEPVTLEVLRGRLASGFPIIAGIDAKHFANLSRSVGHYVVVYGITDRDSQVSQPYVDVHDPELGPEKFITVQNMLDACNGWYGSIICVKPKTVR